MNEAALSFSPIKTLVFDWGNTLMINFPQFDGKMADWPTVQAVEHANAVLEQLSKKYQIVVATNALESDHEDVKKALARVNLDSWISQIFTCRELGSCKPEIGFFEAIEAFTHSNQHEIVLIGDDYFSDIMGAKQAGWSAIWLNPTHQTAPNQLPLQDVDVVSLALLPHALEQGFYPDLNQSLAFCSQNGFGAALYSHSFLVAECAYQLSVWLRSAGIEINPILAHRGGLLHDIAKMQSLNTKPQKDHGIEGAQVLYKLNQPELAEITLRHMLNCLSEPERMPRSWEEKIVNYADKLAEGSSLVSIDERILALQQRYPDYRQSIETHFPALRKIEAEITSTLKATPEGLLEKLRGALNNKA